MTTNPRCRQYLDGFFAYATEAGLHPSEPKGTNNSLRFPAIGEVSQRGQDARPTPSAGVCSPRGTRQAWFGQWRDVPVYALDDLRPGHMLAGPAIIEAETTTVIIDAGDRVTVNALGWLDVALR